MAELDVRGEFDEHASMCLRQAVDQPAGLTTRIIVDLRDLTAVDDRGLQLLNAAVGDGRVRAASLTLLLRGGATQAAIADVLVSAGLPVELTSATAPAALPSGRRRPGAPHVIWGERLYGENGGVSRWRPRVAHLALRARERGAFLGRARGRGHSRRVLATPRPVARL